MSTPNKGWDIRTYCDPQGKANYGRKLQPGSSNPNLSRACLFIHGSDTFLQSSPNPLNVMCLEQLHNSEPYRSLVDAVCEMDYSFDKSWKKILHSHDSEILSIIYLLKICHREWGTGESGYSGRWTPFVKAHRLNQSLMAK